ncbi:MAG: hypothetical protein ACK526_18735 [Planctomyces sp.]
MGSDLVRMLVEAGLGAILGFALVKFAPEQCNQFSRWCRSPKRTGLYIFGFVFFVAAAWVSFHQGSLVFGIVGVLMAILELAALIMVRTRTEESVS